jgi:hypothetical protein
LKAINLKAAWLGVLFVAILGPGRAMAAQAEDAGVKAADSIDENPAHNELRRLKSDVETAVNAAKWKDLLTMLTESVIVTWLDGTQSRGPAEVLEYLESKTGGENPPVQKFSVSVDVARLSELYGDNTAIAFGSSTSTFVLRGREFTATGPWSATMVREGNQWKIASAHSSIGAFDNPLLQWAWRLMWIAAGIAAIVVLALGWWLGRRRTRTV